MKRFKNILRDTWWAWVILIGGGIVSGALVSQIFFSAIPISILAFFYFGLMRYDKNGDAKS